LKKEEYIKKQDLETDDFRKLINRSVSLYPERTAFIVKNPKKDGPTYKNITYKNFADELFGFGTSLINMGLSGEKIAVIGENRYEWCLSYLAVTAGVGIVVPLDKDLPIEEIADLLNQAEVSSLIYSEKIADKISKVTELTKTVKSFIRMDEIKDLVIKGQKLMQEGDNRVMTTDLNPDELRVLLFTSGTTGVSKGVMLSSRNICFDIQSVMQCLDNTCEDTMISILPLHHTYECTCSFLVTMKMGATFTFCEGIRYIAKNIQEYKPSIIMLVPLIIENVYDKVVKKAEATLLKKILFRILLWLSGTLYILGIDIRRKIFKKVHDSMGGNIRWLIAGAAAIDPKISYNMIRLGFNIRQGYGLTECSPIVCVNRNNGHKDNSVGPAMPGITVKLDNPNIEGEGEILVKGPNVMLGYYKNEEATKAVFRDGWFCTGDQGRIDKLGRVYITGRIKNIIVNKTGKNIYPEELEKHLATIPYILESVVWGDVSIDEKDPIISATVVPDEEAIKSARIPDEQKEDVYNLIWNEVKKINKALPAYKRIQAINIRSDAFEKTTTHKIKRYIALITNKAQEISKMINNESTKSDKDKEKDNK